MDFAQFIIYILAFLLGFIIAQFVTFWKFVLMWNQPSGRKELSDRLSALSDAMDDLKRDIR